MTVINFKEIWTALCQKRYLIVFLSFLGYINLYTLRVCLSVAIVSMTDKNQDNSTINDLVFDWDSKQKGVILAAFFYGYILTQLVGGYTVNIVLLSY
jgi:sugar phosphate permease